MINLQTESVRVSSFSKIDAKLIQEDLLMMISEYIDEHYGIDLFEMVINVKMNENEYLPGEDILCGFYNYRLITNQQIDRMTVKLLETDQQKNKMLWFFLKLRDSGGMGKTVKSIDIQTLKEETEESLERERRELQEQKEKLSQEYRDFKAQQ